ncbi:hypothetical protein EDD86DRAFT_248017 [Gorgonomyces haynaldii]|nr:hypothetical protein EDD86DRAFT_248017 [Gorgonomyces haynaldii]
MSNGHKCLKKEELVLEKGPDPFESLERSLEMQKSRQDPLKCIKCGERLGGKDLKAHYNSCWSNKQDDTYLYTSVHCKTCTLDVFSYICHCGQSLKSYQEYLEHHKKHPYLGPDTPAPNRATRQRRESEMRVDSDTSVSVSSDSEPETMPKPKKRTSVEADKQVSRTPSVEANKQVSRTPSVEFIKTETPVRSGKFQQAVPKIVVKEQKPVQKEESPVKKEQKLTPLQKSTKFVFSDETPAAKDIKSSPKSLKRTKAAVKELPPNVVKVDVSPTAQVELNERDPRKRIMDEREMVWWEEDQDEKYCKLCHVELHSQKESDAHVAEHTLQYRDLVLYSKDLECRRCTFVGSNQTELKQHVKTCDKTTFMPYWLCRTCVAPVTFTNAAEYNQHIYYHHHELMMFRVARNVV